MTYFLFILVGTIELLSTIYLCLCLFRFKSSPFVLSFIILSVPILTGNYLIRLEDSISGLASAFTLIMVILFLKVFLNEVSLFWATIMGVVSYILMGIIQGALILIVTVTHISTLSEIQHNHIHGYSLQMVSALINYYIGYYLYKRGIGFTFALDRFKLVRENIVIMIILIGTIITSGLVFIINDYIIITVTLLFPFLYLLYYAIKKQKEDANNTSFSE